MSNREKSAWVELIALIGVWGFYFASLIDAVGSGAIEADGFVRAMGLQFAVCAVLSIVVGAAAGFLLDVWSRRSNAPAPIVFSSRGWTTMLAPSVPRSRSLAKSTAR